jgi:hypothetical protein
MRPLAGGNVGSIPAGGMDVCCECCVLSDRFLCVRLITRPEEFYRVRVSECQRETSIMRRPLPSRSSSVIKKILFCYSCSEIYVDFLSL